MDTTKRNPAPVAGICTRCARYNPDAPDAAGPAWYNKTAPCHGMPATFTGCICYRTAPDVKPEDAPHIKTEILLTWRNNPRDPYGPPLLGFIVKATAPDHTHPLYIRTSSEKGYTWTQDPLYARHFSRKTAQRHADYLSNLDRLPNP